MINDSTRPISGIGGLCFINVFKIERLGRYRYVIISTSATLRSIMRSFACESVIIGNGSISTGLLFNVLLHFQDLLCCHMYALLLENFTRAFDRELTYAFTSRIQATLLSLLRVPLS